MPSFATAAQENCGPLKLVAAMDMRFDGAGRPVVPVTLDGKEKYLLLDTGAFMSMLNRNVFDELRAGSTKLNKAISGVFA